MPAPARRILLALLVATVAFAVLACGEDRGAREEAIAPLYVAIGASDAVGTGARDPATEGWVPVLHGKMPQGTKLANLGVGGMKLHQALDQALPVAVDLKPTTVTIWMAVNDYGDGVSLAAYRADLDTMLAALRRDTRARVYVANIPDLTLLPAFANRDPALLQRDIGAWNTEIAASVAANGAALVDLYGGWQDLRERRNLISRDGLHPSRDGHRRIAEIFWSAMQAT